MEFDGLFTIDKKGSKGEDKRKKRKGDLKAFEDDDAEGREEAELEDVLFGTGGVLPESDLQRKKSKAATGANKGSKISREAAWHDADDQRLSIDVEKVDRLRKLRKTEDESELAGDEYTLRLRNQFNKMNPSVSWATRKSDDTSMDGDAGLSLLQTTSRLLSKSMRLPQSILEIERLKDANISDVSDAVIQSVRFHPSSHLMLSAGLDKRLKLFQVDGKSNPKVQGVFFEDLPIRTAEFSADGSEIFLCGRRKFFYVYDLAAAAVKKVQGIMGRQEKCATSLYVAPDNDHLVVLGNCGHISVLSRRTKQWIGDLKMNHDARAAAFGSDGRSLYTGGGGGLMYHWDLRMRKCIRKIVDEGSIGISSLSMSLDGTKLAVGSTSGVVNTYDMHALNAAPVGPSGAVEPAVHKSMMNLTTEVTSTRFNADSQVLAMASQAKKESLRLVHAASGTVFSNWPTHSTPLHHVCTLDFSPTSTMLAVGNDRGKVPLSPVCRVVRGCRAAHGRRRVEGANVQGALLLQLLRSSASRCDDVACGEDGEARIGRPTAERLHAADAGRTVRVSTAAGHNNAHCATCASQAWQAAPVSSQGSLCMCVCVYVCVFVCVCMCVCVFACVLWGQVLLYRLKHYS
jgi:U3 small nucleolar RNA-associated protein 18